MAGACEAGKVSLLEAASPLLGMGEPRGIIILGEASVEGLLGPYEKADEGVPYPLGESL